MPTWQYPFFTQAVAFNQHTCGIGIRLSPTSGLQIEPVWVKRAILTFRNNCNALYGGHGFGNKDPGIRPLCRPGLLPGPFPERIAGLTLVVTAEAELATRLVIASLLPVVQGAGAVAGVGSREGTTGSGRRPGRALRLLAVPPPAPEVTLQTLVAPWVPLTLHSRRSQPTR